jgi:hypothetical protein
MPFPSAAFTVQVSPFPFAVASRDSAGLVICTPAPLFSAALVWLVALAIDSGIAKASQTC